MKREKIKILYKKVNYEVRELEIVDELETMQKLVGGLIEVLPYKDDVLIICNEEGKINNMLPNLMFKNDYIAGDCFFVKDTDMGEFTSLTDEDIRNIKNDIKKRSFVYTKEKKFVNETEREC